MRIIFCGDRNWNDAVAIHDVMVKLRQEFPALEIIEGEAPGADKMSRDAAKKLGITFLPFYAEWSTYGKGAGPIRNKQMLVEGKADGVVAFHEDLKRSKGTANMVGLAVHHGRPVWVYNKELNLDSFISSLKGEMSFIQHQPIAERVGIGSLYKRASKLGQKAREMFPAPWNDNNHITESQADDICDMIAELCDIVSDVANQSGAE